jgi:hypothetical protein
MITVKNAIIRVVAEKLREYYLRGIRDARVEFDESVMPNFLEKFDAGNFDEALDRHDWLKIAKDMMDL